MIPMLQQSLLNDDIETSISEKMRNFENIIENLEKDKVRDGNPKSRGKKNEVKTSKVTTEATKNEQETENVSTANTDDHQSSSAKHKVVWVGISLSKALDPIKLKKDLDVDLHMVKAYCIEPEGKFQESSFRAIVPKVVKEADTIVLQTVSMEITNLDVNNSLVDPSKDVKVSKREWFDKVEAASSSLFRIAEECVAADPKLNVIIVKRPARFNRSSVDILGIKPKLSVFGNTTYDQLLLKSSYSDRIHLVELNLLNNSKSNYLRSIIYGTHDNPEFDGIHMMAGEASRHFTERCNQ